LNTAANSHYSLPPSLQVIERGWLSSNNILLFDGARTALIDTGYVGQATQTVDLVRSRLLAQSHTARLDAIINTHSHSDHIGGNAALKAALGGDIIIPAGIEDVIRRWDEHALLLSPACQRGERFEHQRTLAPGDDIELGGLLWEVLTAPGHDMHALMFYCREQRLLISGDALWEDGFGVVFNELMAAEFDASTGADVGGFAAARQTLESIARLDIATVVPGHGKPFADIEGALARSFGRLTIYEQDKVKLGRNAVKACFTFNLLDMERLEEHRLADYVAGVPFFAMINRTLFGMDDGQFAEWLLADLLRARAVAVKDGWIVPLMAA
jgi:glyoxylase-like metal-dependent hydrolase (beta-lactamase superfamily II)